MIHILLVDSDEFTNIKENSTLYPTVAVHMTKRKNDTPEYQVDFYDGIYAKVNRSYLDEQIAG